MITMLIKIRNSMTLLFIITIFYSCGSNAPAVSPTEIKLMTTKQYDEPYEVVYKSAMSLLQSEQFVIEQTDMQTGLIVASKRIQNKNADLNRALWGFSNDANTAKGVIIVDKVNEQLSEVKLTIYEGKESSSLSGFGGLNKDKKEEMVTNPDLYNKWFTSLTAEIERRKALR